MKSKKRLPACKLYFGRKLFILINNTDSYWSIKICDITIPKLLQWLGFWTEHDVQMELAEFSSRGTSGHSGLFSMAAISGGSVFPKCPGSRTTWYHKPRPSPSSPHWATPFSSEMHEQRRDLLVWLQGGQMWRDHLKIRIYVASPCISAVFALFKQVAYAFLYPESVFFCFQKSRPVEESQVWENRHFLD